MESNMYYDVIFIGGGIAGCATALAIQRAGHSSTSILLIDDSNPSTFKIGESLPAEGKQVLRYLSTELCQTILRTTPKPYIKSSGNASAWASGSLEHTPAIVNALGAGWHLDRVSFEEIMQKEVSNTTNVHRLSKTRFLDVTASSQEGKDQHWVIEVKESESEIQHTKKFYTKWVVDASGRKAAVAHKLGANILRTDALLAFYMVFKTSTIINNDLDHFTLVEATQNGWWYTSKLPNNQRVVVYHTDDDDPSAKNARKLDEYLTMLQSEAGHIWKCICDGEYDVAYELQARFPICVSANSSYLDVCEGRRGELRWCAVGDAALAFDPLSSQGMVTALKMGCIVGDIIARDTGGENVIEGEVTAIASQVREKYEREKDYFYSQVRRFSSQFWERRR